MWVTIFHFKFAYFGQQVSENSVFRTTYIHEHTVKTMISHNASHWAIPENIHTPPADDTELGTQKFQDFQDGQQQYIQDSKPC